MMKPPEGGSVALARLWRFVGPEDMPDVGVVATHDQGKNLTRINKDLFDLLSPIQQQVVFNSREAVTYVLLSPE